MDFLTFQKSEHILIIQKFIESIPISNLDSDEDLV